MTPIQAMKISILYGSLRSGTTLLRLMLDGHPDLWVPGESDFVFDYLHDVNGEVQLDREGLSLDRIRRNNLPKLPAASSDAACVHEMTNQLAEGRPHLILSLHRNIAWAMRLFPDAQIVHLLRDPRDVARSCIGMGWCGTPLYGAKTWLETERQWASTRPSIADEQVLDVRYEELIASPEEHLAQIARHLGAAYHPDMLSYPDSSTYGPVDASLAFQWKRKMSPHDASLVEGAVDELLTQTGYEHSEAGPIVQGPLGRASQATQNLLIKWRWRFQKFGIVDPLLVTLGNRLHWSGIAANARERIKDKTNALLL